MAAQKLTCSLCGRRIRRTPGVNIKHDPNVVYSHFTHSYFCGPGMGLDRCKALYAKRKRQAQATSAVVVEV